MNASISYLRGRLRDFKRRYYLREALKGAILSAIITIIWGLLTAAVAYYYPLSSMVRSFLFYGSLLGLSVMWSVWVLWPLFKALTLKAALSDEAAAAVIGRHFPEIEDRLLNILQMEKTGAAAPDDRRLIEAAIAQKASTLRAVPFELAVRFRNALRLLKYLAPAAGLLALIAWLAPAVLSEGTQRLIQHQRPIDAFAPFQFIVENPALKVPRGRSFTLRVRLRGEQLPDEVFVVSGGQRLPMNVDEAGRFSFLFRDVRAPVRFHLEASGFRSEPHMLEVLPAPALKGITVTARYPNYLRLQDEVFEDEAAVEVPAGTHLNWQLRTRDVEEVFFLWSDTVVRAVPRGENLFETDRRVMQSGAYRVVLRHSAAQSADTHAYFLSVVADEPPSITAAFSVDTVGYQYVTVQGELADDHGFSGFWWVWSADPAGRKWQKFRLPLPGGEARYHPFFHWKALDSLWQTAPEVKMYLMVADNDRVSGPKTARTPVFILRKPSSDELRRQEEQAQEKAARQMSASAGSAEQLRRQLERKLLDMMQRENVSWQDRQALQEMMRRLEEQKETWQKAIEELEKMERRRQSLEPTDPQTNEALKALRKRMAEIFDEAFQKQLAELQKMLKDERTGELEKKLKELLDRQKAMEQAMKRDMAMYKRWRMERTMEWEALKLDDLARRQEELARQTRQEKLPADSLHAQQEALKQELDSLKKAHEGLEKMAQELDEQIPDLDDALKQAGRQMKQAGQQLQQQQNQKAAQSQQAAAQKMKKAAEKMLAALQQRRKNTLMVSRQKLRQILDNLLEVSRRQEALEQEATASPRSRKYLRMMERQRQLNEVMADVEDSLYALAEEVPTIQGYVFKEVEEIRHQQQRVVSFMTERNVRMTREAQRRVMMSVNKLALMLSEILDNLTMQLSSMMSSSGQCNNPAPAPMPSLGQMQQMQKELQQQMEGMKSGSQGQQKQGRQQGQQNSDPRMTQEMAKILMQQEYLRHQIRRMREEMEAQQRKKIGPILQEIEKMMEQVEKDIVHQRLGPATSRRMERIRVRMLEAERAVRQQDESPERESRTAEFVPPKPPPSLQKYLEEKNRHAELLRRLPPQLTPFYQQRARRYLRQIPTRP